MNEWNEAMSNHVIVAPPPTSAATASLNIKRDQSIRTNKRERERVGRVQQCVCRTSAKIKSAVRVLTGTSLSHGERNKVKEDLLNRHWCYTLLLSFSG